jgi:hypothetical protein
MIFQWYKVQSSTSHHSVWNSKHPLSWSNLPISGDHFFLVQKMHHLHLQPSTFTSHQLHIIQFGTPAKPAWGHPLSWSNLPQKWRPVSYTCWKLQRVISFNTIELYMNERSSHAGDMTTIQHHNSKLQNFNPINPGRNHHCNLCSYQSTQKCCLKTHIVTFFTNPRRGRLVVVHFLCARSASCVRHAREASLSVRGAKLFNSIPVELSNFGHWLTFLVETFLMFYVQ